MTIVSRAAAAIVEFRLGWAAWTAHDGHVTAFLVILLAVVLLATLGGRQGARGPARSDGTASRATARKTPNPYWLLGAVLLGLVLLRFGVNWLVVASGMVVALLRGLLPLLRFLPLLSSFRRGAGMPGAEAGPGSRPFGSRPGDAGSAGSSARSQRMTRQEALQVFGLDDQATREDVQREYRRLMRKIHPDLGGSSYLAAKLNEAKDVLS